MIGDNLRALQKELPAGVTLVAVSKFHPAQAIREAYAASQRIFAESRPQELAAKVDALSDLGELEWHFIGHLQTNKLKLVLPYVSLVQSVDSQHLLRDISDWGVRNDRVIPVLLELHLGAEQTKQGFHEEEILDVLFDADSYPGVKFRGLMGMATNTDDEGVVDADFTRIDTFMAYLTNLFPELEEFNQLSIGMSGDWKIAIRHGATMVRIGSAIFGARE